MVAWVGVRGRARRLWAAVICVAALFAAAPDPCAAQSADTIIVHGNRRLDAAAIRKHFQALPGVRLDQAVANAGLKSLYATGLFEDVRLAWSGSRLVVTVVEAPVIDRVRFEGNSQLKEKDLAKDIRSKAHTPLTKAA